MYKENWAHELKEHYVAVTFEEYESIFKLLGMELQLKDSYLLPYLREKWKIDFGFADEELVGFKSTAILVARKVSYFF